jgi:hypothetical protein
LVKKYFCLGFKFYGREDLLFALKNINLNS